MWEGPYSVIKWGYPWVQECFNTQTNTHDKAARSLQTFRSSDLFLFDTYPFAALLRPSCPELPVLSFACLSVYLQTCFIYKIRGIKIHMNSVFRILWSVCVWICIQFVCCSIYHIYIYAIFLSFKMIHIPGYSGIHHVDQSDLKLREICLLLLPKH